MRTETFQTPGPVTLVVRVPAGRVELETVDRPETHVALESPGGGDEAENAARIELRDRGGGAEVAVEIQPRFGFGDEDYRVAITAPHGSTVETTTSSADVEGRGRFGALDATTASGDVLFQDVDGDVRAKSASGDVILKRVGGRVGVETALGDVIVKSLAGDGTVRSASGDVIVKEADASLRVQTASGDHTIGSVAAGQVTLQSASGEISVGIRRGSRLWVDARSMSGTTSSDLDVGDVPDSEEGPLVELRATSMSGDIRVFRA